MSKIQQVIYLRDKLLSGTPLTAQKTIKLIAKEFDENLELRSAQRYIKELEKLVPYAESKRNIDNQKEILVSSKYQNTPNNFTLHNNHKNYILSLNMLKAHLRSFNNTTIEVEVDRLIDKIEQETNHNSNAYSAESMYWDQNFGQFDYSSDQKYSDTINNIINHISDKTWIKVNYKRPNKKDTEFNCLFREFFEYDGVLYVAAYIPYYKDHVALAIQYIDDIKIIKQKSIEIPKFSFIEFTKNRFGVYHGELNKVSLEIDKNYKEFFLNRNFHSSQLLFNEFNEDENLILNIKVPLSPELSSWILKWGGVIKVKSPEALKIDIENKAKNFLP